MTVLPYGLRHLLLRAYPLIRPLLPRGHRPWRVRGSRLFLDPRESPMMWARILEIYEASKFEAIAHFLGAGMTFVDVGANKGDFTLFAAGLVGPSGRVVSCEPEPGNMAWLERSVALAPQAPVELHQLALGADEGRATLYLGRKSGWHSLTEGLPQRDRGSIEVEVRRLDSLLGEARVDVIKVDVEGAEQAVLEGCAETLERNRQAVLMVDLHPKLGVSVSEFLRTAAELGFGAHSTEAPFRPVEAGEVASEVLLRATDRSSSAPASARSRQVTR